MFFNKWALSVEHIIQRFDFEYCEKTYMVK